jgi:hypothetical protein
MRPEGLVKLKKFMHLISSRTRDLLACSVVNSSTLPHTQMRARGSVVVKALCFKLEDRGFKTRRGESIFFSLPNPSSRTRPWSLLSL